MTAAMTMTAAPPVMRATTWVVPPPMIGALQPGDQVVRMRGAGVMIHDVLGLIEEAAGCLAVLREAEDLAGEAVTRAGGFAATIVLQISAPLGELCLTLAEPQPTGRAWLITDMQIVCTQRTTS